MYRSKGNHQDVGGRFGSDQDDESERHHLDSAR